MATIEKNALVRAKDAQDNSYLIYPITKAENVDGLETFIALTDAEIMECLNETGIYTVVTDANGIVYTDETGTILYYM